MSAATIAHSGPSWFQGKDDLGVYVIEFLGSQTFAFEARSRADAEEVARGAWFTQALDSFCSNRPGLSNRPVLETASNCLRVATDHEAAAFRELAEEFAGETNGVLVAYLGWDKHGF
jgi:hypothetical protein